MNPNPYTIPPPPNPYPQHYNPNPPLYTTAHPHIPQIYPQTYGNIYTTNTNTHNPIIVSPNTKRILPTIPTDGPPSKRHKPAPLSAHQLMAKRLSDASNPLNPIPLFTNPYSRNQKVQVREGDLPMWLDGTVVDIGYDWIQVRYNGFSQDYDSTIYVDPNNAESNQYCIRLLNNDSIKHEIEMENDSKHEIKMESLLSQLHALVKQKRKELNNKQYTSVYQEIKAFLHRLNVECVPNEKYPLLAELYVIYASCLGQMSEYSLAVQYCKKCIDIAPKYYKGYTTLAVLYEFEQRYSEASELFKSALQCDMSESKRRHIQQNRNKLVIAMNESENSNSHSHIKEEHSDNGMDMDSDESEQRPIKKKRSTDSDSDTDTESDTQPIVSTEEVKLGIKGKGVKGTTLDQRIMDTSLMSAVQKKAYTERATKPNGFYYRFNDNSEEQKNGQWSESEHRAFMQRILRKGANIEWGLLSRVIEGRVGYQCSNYWRKLIEDGCIRDDNYVMGLNKKGKEQWRQLKKKEIEQGSDGSEDYFVRFRKYQFTVLKDPSGTFQDLPCVHPKAPNASAKKSKRKRSKKERKKVRKKKDRKKKKKHKKKRDSVKKEKGIKTEEPSNEFLCPITYVLMCDPVMVRQSGWTYEREAIQNWITNNGNDPNTRQRCTVQDLIPNRTLRGAISRWKESVGYVKTEK